MIFVSGWFINIFSRRAISFLMWAKLFKLNFFNNKKTFSLNGQTREVKSSVQPSQFAKCPALNESCVCCAAKCKMHIF